MHREEAEAQREAVLCPSGRRGAAPQPQARRRQEDLWAPACLEEGRERSFHEPEEAVH